MRRRDFLFAAGSMLGAAGTASPTFGQRGAGMPSFDQTPDKPQSFGYKVSWFAVKASDPASVLDTLEFTEVTRTNWASGLAAAYQDGTSRGDAWVFVSPPVSGWVLIVGFWLPYPAASIEGLDDVGSREVREAVADVGKRFDALFSRLMKRFADVQFFGSYRVVGLVAWARALNGKPVRIFAFADGAAYANIGEQTPEEGKLRFANLTGLSPSDAGRKIFKMAEDQSAEEDGLVARGLSRREARARLLQNRRNAIPGEQDVVDLAALWSVDPTRLSDQQYPPGLGLAARLRRT